MKPLVDHYRKLAILAIWCLLGASHPDGMMQIIDRRISYRRVLLSALSLPNIERHTEQRSLSTPNLPVTVLEVVIRFGGTCVAIGALHTQLARIFTTYAELFAGENANSSVGSSGGELDARLLLALIISQVMHCNAAATTAAAADTLTALAPGGDAGMLSLTMPATQPTGGSQSTGSSLNSGRAKTSNDHGSGGVSATASAATVASQIDAAHEMGGERRAYLIEMQLVFDHSDRITTWKTEVLASESVP